MTIFLTFISSFFSIFIFVRYLLLIEMRVDANTFKTLYSICKNDSKFLITEEFISETRYPAIYQAICFFKNAPFFHLNHSERLMTAGFQGKEHYTVITCFRWNYKKLKLFLFTKLNEVQKETLGIPVQLMLPYNTDKIGTLKGSISFPKTMNILPDFEKEVKLVSEGKLVKTGALLYGPPGNGKCLAKGTLVMLYNGKFVEVENIKVGDLLMGPDSNPRKVLSLANGKEKLYDIIPVKGDTYTVNESHILSLKMSCAASGYKKGEIVNVSVKDYLLKSNNFKHCAKGYRVGINFQEKELDLDPYLLGVWLGGGTSSFPSITTADEEIKNYIYSAAQSMGLKVSILGTSGKSKTYGINSDPNRGCHQRGKNVFLNYLKKYNLLNNKHIPSEFLYNSKENRLKLLAGIIDTDGEKNNNCFNIITKIDQFAEDILYLSRSLGLAAYKSICYKKNQYGFKGRYNRISISGELSNVPVKIKYKQYTPRKQKKDVLVTGIEVKEKEVGEYYGFELDGDGLFLLGDFTVTHNTFYIKYLATKYSLPIMIFTLNPEWNNHDLLLLFSQIPNRCLVLLEDFDNYFNKRKSLFEDKVKFTYDILLNGLDGVFNTYQNVVFMMTVNDIEKVDDALKNRPSRFKYTKLFANPDLETRRELIQDWAERTENLNLDQIFRLSEYKNQGNSFVDAMNRLEKKVSVEEIAYFNWKDRIDSGLEGNPEDDWFDAEEMSKGYADDV